MADNALLRNPFRRARQTAAALGVFLGTDRAWAFRPQAATALVKEYPISGDWQALFAAIARDFGPATLQLVLGAHYYQLLTADKPNVPEAEIAQALVWSVKDLVSSPVANIHLDYFESSLGNSNKLQVVVTDKPQIIQLLQAALSKGLQWGGISITELMTANLFRQDNHARLVLSHVPGEDLLLTVVRGGELCMQRRVRGFRELDTIAAADLHYGVADNLSLEIQRSMDFFESQLRQPPVTSIELLLQGEVNTLAQLLGGNFNQPVRADGARAIGAKMAELGYLELQRGRA